MPALIYTRQEDVRAPKGGYMVDAEAASESPHQEPRGPSREQTDKLRKDLAEFIRLETQIAATLRAPQLRRAGTEAAGVAACVVAGLAAFALANVAVVLAIEAVLPGWAAALILAGVWLCVALVTGSSLARRAAPIIAALRGDGSGAPADLVAGRDAAWTAVRDDLRSIGPRLAEQAAAAAEPLAARVAVHVAEHAAGDVVTVAVEEAGDLEQELVDESEEIVEDLPGAGIANSVWDLALLPGRTGIRMVTTVLKRPNPDE